MRHSPLDLHTPSCNSPRGSGQSRQWLWAGELRGPVAVECSMEQGRLFPSEGAEAQSLGFQKPRNHQAGHTWVSYASLTSPTFSSPMVQHCPSREWVSDGLGGTSLHVCVTPDLSRLLEWKDLGSSLTGWWE